MKDNKAPRQGNRGAVDHCQAGADRFHDMPHRAERHAKTPAGPAEGTEPTAHRSECSRHPGAARLRYEILPVQIHGVKVAAIVPALPDNAPGVVREGIARRRVVATGQPCPCRASSPFSRQVVRAARKAGVIPASVVEHADGCPAGDDVLIPALGGWGS